MRQSLPTTLLTEILKTMGPVDHSIENLAHRLYSLDPEAATAGIVRAGGSISQTLSPEQTIAVRNNANISTSALIAVNSGVRVFQPGMKSIFSPYTACRELENKSHDILNFSVFSYEEPDKSRTGDKIQISLPYSHGSPFDALRVHLSNLMNNNQMKSKPSLGIDLGEEGKVIPIIIMGDAGGGIMSFCGEFHSFEGSGQKFNMNLGEFKGKESYFLLKNTVIPTIAKGIEQLNNHFALVLEWDKGFDYVMIPAEVCNPIIPGLETFLPAEILIERRIGEQLMEAIWADGKASFTRSDIPDVYNVKCLRLLAFSNGDFAYLMMLFGREEYKSTKCLCCHLSRTLEGANFQERHDSVNTGRLYTLDTIMQEINDFRKANSDEEENEDDGIGLTAEEYDILRRKSAQCQACSGITDKEPLLQGIPMDRTAVPVLHIMLGLVNNLDSNIKKFVRLIEPDLPDIRAKREELDVATCDRKRLEDERDR